MWNHSETVQTLWSGSWQRHSIHWRVPFWDPNLFLKSHFCLKDFTATTNKTTPQMHTSTFTEHCWTWTRHQIGLQTKMSQHAADKKWPASFRVTKPGEKQMTFTSHTKKTWTMLVRFVWDLLERFLMLIFLFCATIHWCLSKAAPIPILKQVKWNWRQKPILAW